RNDDGGGVFLDLEGVIAKRYACCAHRRDVIERVVTRQRVEAAIGAKRGIRVAECVGPRYGAPGLAEHLVWNDLLPPAPFLRAAADEADLVGVGVAALGSVRGV